MTTKMNLMKKNLKAAKIKKINKQLNGIRRISMNKLHTKFKFQAGRYLKPPIS